MSKAMSKVIGGHNLRATVVMALLAVLLLLALVVAAPSATTSSDRDGTPGIQAMNANSTGGARQS
jgi:hypothetical protein